MRPIVKNTQNNCLYEFLGGNKFRNLLTEKEGDVDDETARRIFKFNIEATEIINEYPMVSELIKKLQLKITK